MMWHFSIILFLCALVIVLISLGAVVAVRRLSPNDQVDQQPVTGTPYAPQPLSIAGPATTAARYA